MIEGKSFEVSLQLIKEAWRQVKRNAGSHGIDRVTIKEFGNDLENNLYKLWNRMSSGSYMPPGVRGVSIPKSSGGRRLLGIPTVMDRVAQTVVKQILEEKLDIHFHDNSFGYRPNKSAHDAIEVTRKRCWKFDWVLEFDIRRMFDEIPHSTLLSFLRTYVNDRWILLYCERWLKAPMVLGNDNPEDRLTGTPQGGVVSPILANLFMHVIFDSWMKNFHSELEWCRYADDGIIHCRSLEEAKKMKVLLKEQLELFGLRLHEDKTQIIYCRDGKRKDSYPVTKFEFLGFEFRTRKSKGRYGGYFYGFLPAISPSSESRIKRQIKYKLTTLNRTDKGIEQLAKSTNAVFRGWVEYYGKFYKSRLTGICWYMEQKIFRWIRRKFGGQKRLSISKAWAYLQSIRRQNPKLFVHWGISYPMLSAVGGK